MRRVALLTAAGVLKATLIPLLVRVCGPRQATRRRAVMRRVVPMAALLVLAVTTPAFADTATVTRSDGYQVTLTGPATATVGVATTYTATCGPIGWYGSPCPYGEFRAFGGPINRLGEGFGTGAQGSYTFRAAGGYQVRYRVGAKCIGSPRQSCPIDVWLGTTVT